MIAPYVTRVDGTQINERGAVVAWQRPLGAAWCGRSITPRAALIADVQRIEFEEP